VPAQLGSARVRHPTSELPSRRPQRRALLRKTPFGLFKKDMETLLARANGSCGMTAIDFNERRVETV
jgi:hypothetical protein